MANCQKFKQWLTNQEYADETASRQAKNHIQDCQTCAKLFQTDMALDTMLKKAMQADDPPPGLTSWDGLALIWPFSFILSNYRHFVD
jgi:hypothetical protein